MSEALQEKIRRYLNLPENEFSVKGLSSLLEAKSSDLWNNDFPKESSSEMHNFYRTTMETIIVELEKLRCQADTLLDLNMITEKEHIEYMEYLKRVMKMAKQCNYV